MRWWRQFRRWFQKSFLGYVEPSVYAREVPIGETVSLAEFAENFHFVGEFEKGPVDERVLVASMHDFVQKFGQVKVAPSVAAEVYEFFREGGRSAYIVRVMPKEKS